MIIQEGYVYHIKDEYFDKAQDDKLMQNKENGNYRPTFYCLKDERNPLLWMVPMSSRWEKFKPIYDRQKERYGRCLTIVLGEYDRKKAAFLIQNMFPVTEYYLDHIHTRNNNPVPVKYSIQREVSTNVKRALLLHSKGKRVVFPDISRLEKIMLDELENDDKKVEESK
ncbi:MAG: hypothetical protein LUG99_06690 [Lachnospiraceae bacterium]|nr:hypothetical protein [Lachnospiraceae bacterium]